MNPLNLLGHRYTAQRGRGWLLVIVVLGGLMIGCLFPMLLGWISPALWFAVFLAWAASCVIACLDFVVPILKDEGPTQRELEDDEPTVAEGQIWRDNTAPHALIVIRVLNLSEKVVLIERVTETYPNSKGKLFKALISELLKRYEPALCWECNEPVGGAHKFNCPYRDTPVSVVTVEQTLPDHEETT